MKTLTFKLQACDIEALAALAKLGFWVLLTEEATKAEIKADGWRAIWGKEHAESTVLKTEKEVRDFFASTFEAKRPIIFCYREGSHVGGFRFQFGWGVHNKVERKRKK